MANAVLGWPIYSDVGVLYTPTLSGGSWQAALPLTNLQDSRMKKVARSTDATTGNTQFEIDLIVPRAVRVIALPFHNLQSAATVRVKAYTGPSGSGSLVYDSTALTVWPAGATAETLQGMRLGFTLVPTTAQTARYWQVFIDDHTNTFGYVDVGRLILAAGYQPSINMSYGAKLGLTSLTQVDQSDGSAKFYYEKDTGRFVQFELTDEDETELLTNGFDMQRIAGLSGQIHFVWDPSDTVHMFRRAFTGVPRALTPLEAPYMSRATLAYELEEAL